MYIPIWSHHHSDSSQDQYKVCYPAYQRFFLVRVGIGQRLGIVGPTADETSGEAARKNVMNFEL